MCRTSTTTLRFQKSLWKTDSILIKPRNRGVFYGLIKALIHTPSSQSTQCLDSCTGAYKLSPEDVDKAVSISVLTLASPVNSGFQRFVCDLISLEYRRFFNGLFSKVKPSEARIWPFLTPFLTAASRAFDSYAQAVDKQGYPPPAWGLHRLPPVDFFAQVSVGSQALKQRVHLIKVSQFQ